MKFVFKCLLLPTLLLGISVGSCKKDDSVPVKAEELLTQVKIVIPHEEMSNVAARANAQGADEYNTFYGPAVQFGEGHVRSWANISHEDKPLAIGIEFTAGVLQQQHLHEPGVNEHGHEALMPMHQKAKALMPFDHLTMGFMAAGHPPPGIYSVPHFDFHFYKMPLADRLAIPAYPLAIPAFNNNPPAGYLPPLCKIARRGGKNGRSLNGCDFT